LAQFELFWVGEAKWARDISERASSSWSKDIPGYSAYLAIRSFGLEETGQYEEAERLGRLSIELDPGDCWAAHSVAHVLEMEGRLEEGIEWLDSLKNEWEGANHIVHHLWWHRCLFESERGDHAGALQGYDQYVRNPDSQLVKAIPDFYLDIQNCASMLLRLELRGIDVGNRWEPIAEIAEARIGNHSSPFTSAHCAIALIASGRVEQTKDLIEQMRSFANDNSGTLGPRYAAATIPASEAAIAHRQGEHEKVLQILMPARRSLWQMGGSHAQRDLFFQIIADSAVQLGRNDLSAILMDDIRSIGFGHLDARTSYADMVS
jgi:tetratricopeptide (TPR) repeat protein